MSRPKRNPILPDQVDETKEKPVIGLRVLYPEEKKKLQKKLEERGFSSISEWFREQARKVLQDTDLRERKEELENRIKKRETRIKEDRKELEDIKKQLESKEEIIEDQLEDLRRLLKRNCKDLDVRTKREGFVEDRVPVNTSLRFSDQERAKEIIYQNYREFLRNNNDREGYVNKVVQKFQEENLLEVKT